MTHDPTHAVYEDPVVVSTYIEKNARDPKMRPFVEAFADRVYGNRILDLGCGPGQDSYVFAELGFSVTGLDYSKEMIKQAKALRKLGNAPTFKVGDMRNLGKLFDPDSFDAVFAAASLIHLDAKELVKVLSDINAIVVDSGMVFISLKKGEGETLEHDTKYGKPTERKIIRWTKESFMALTSPLGWTLVDYGEVPSLSKPDSTWLQFTFQTKVKA